MHFALKSLDIILIFILVLLILFVYLLFFSYVKSPSVWFNCAKISWIWGFGYLARFVLLPFSISIILIRWNDKDVRAFEKHFLANAILEIIVIKSCRYLRYKKQETKSKRNTKRKQEWILQKISSDSILHYFNAIPWSKGTGKWILGNP